MASSATASLWRIVCHTFRVRIGPRQVDEREEVGLDDMLDAIADLDRTDLLDPREFELAQVWRDVPLSEGLPEDPSAAESPLKLCAAPYRAATSGHAGEEVEFQIVANPLALAQRARLSIYPPWRLGPDVRFSWRLEPRVCETMDAEVTPRAGTQAAASQFQLLSNLADAEIDTPARFLLPLRPHQLCSLAWMQACERPGREPLLLGTGREFLPLPHPPHPTQQMLVAALGCRAVARVQRAFPVRGGILADQVGSGKTAVTLALVEAGLAETKPCGPTLIVAPGRLIAQWSAEVIKFMGKGSWEVLTFPGACTVTHVPDMQKLASAHVVFASYELLLEIAEARRRSGDLSSSASKRRRVDQFIYDVERAFEETSFARVVIDEFHEILRPDWARVCTWLQQLRFDALWGLSGTPPLGCFESVASMADIFGIDLKSFRHQLDASQLAQRTLDHLARANTSAELEGLRVQEDIVSLYHTPAERAIYMQAANKVRHDGAWEVSADGKAFLLQLCSHFHLDEDSACGDDAETQCAQALHEREAAAESAREWLRRTVCRMEAQVLAERVAGSLEIVAMEQYEQLLGEIGFSGVLSAEGMEHQISGARAAGGRTAGHRHEREADELIRSAISYVRETGEAYCDHANSPRAGLLELFEEVKQAKELFRQRLHEHTFLGAMLEAADADHFQCPICFVAAAPTERAIIAGCAHLFCLSCATRLARAGGPRECALCRQELLRGEDEVLRVREPGAVLPEERDERRRWGRFGSKLFHVVRKLREIERTDPTARAIVFVQWASLRRKVAAAFTAFEVPFVSLDEFTDGDAAVATGPRFRNLWERDDVITAFQGAPATSTAGPKVLLLSLQDAASGTNLTRANHVLFVHPMSAPSRRSAVAYELQALGRCVRLGQTKPVYLWRFVTLATVEEELSLLHQAELWKRRPELWSSRREAGIPSASNVEREGTNQDAQDECDELDLDDLFW